jgi:ferric-dicitrate binding protein FerR (iron transport regulator)/tetratricopeptide (TPR) repeat protein
MNPDSTSDQGIGDRNVERLIGVAYRPESPDAAFAERASAAMRAAAAERCLMALDRSPRRVRWVRRAAFWTAAATLLITLGTVLGMWLGGGDRDVVGLPNGRPDAEVIGHRPAPRASATAETDPVRERGRLLPLGGLTPQPAARSLQAERLAVGQSLRTGPAERRRVELPDGSVLYVNRSTSLTLAGIRHVTLHGGEVFVEVAPRHGQKDEAAPAGPRFVVRTPQREITALGTKFDVRHDDRQGTGVLVTQGKVQVSGLRLPVLAGQQLGVWAEAPAGEESPPTAAPRASYVLDWTRDLLADSRAPLVPASGYAGGALVAKDPSGRETRLSLRRYHVDVYIEDGFSRTTIDQTYFNHEPRRLEGTFYFPLPPDASLSRLAMYVNGRLMEGGMAERQHAREVFETIVRKMQDPALLEWIDGSTFRMRVFPLEGRQEKRIILSYTQRLASLYGRMQYRFPGGHSLGQVDRWSASISVKGGAGLPWESDSHKFDASVKDGDLLLAASAERATPERDIALVLGQPQEGRSDTATPSVRFSSARHEGSRYLMLRWRPDLPRQKQTQRRDWVFVFESSADRNPLLARVQIDAIKTLLDNAERDDTLAILTAGTRVQVLDEKPLPVTPENVQRALAFLEGTHLVGALDLGRALGAAGRLTEGSENPVLVHVGSGLPVLGDKEVKALVGRVPERVAYVGVGVGKRWSRAFMKAAAARSGGYYTQISPDENVPWRAFDLLATLNTPRLLGINVTDRREETRFLAHDDSLAHGEELCVIARLAPGRPTPEEVHVTGTLDGKPFARKIAVRDVTQKADYLPRTWAKLEIDRLVADGAEKHQGEIIPLSKAMYVMSPFTSLLVLENEEMYKQYRVDRGRKDHWAMYPCPASIPVVSEPQLPAQGAASQAGQQTRPKKPSAEEVLRTILVRTPPRLLVWPPARDAQPVGVPVSEFVCLGWEGWYSPWQTEANEDYSTVDFHSAMREATRRQFEEEQRRQGGNGNLAAAKERSAVQEKVTQLVDRFNSLMDEQRFAEAEAVAKRASELDPHNPIVEQLTLQSKFVRRFFNTFAAPGGKEQGRVNMNAMGGWGAFSAADRTPLVYPDASEWERLTQSRSRLMLGGGVNSDAGLLGPVRLGTRVYPVADLVLPIRRPASGNGFADFDSLIDLITSTVRPQSWYAADAPHWQFPDDPPVVYPDADAWARLTSRPSEWYANGGLDSPWRAWGSLSLERYDPDQAIDLASRGQAEKRVQDALRSPTHLEFVEAPLQDVIDYLKDLHGIEIQVDKKALDDVGIANDTPITKQLKGISLRSALRLILRDLDLTYVIQDEVLLITTPEEAESSLTSGVPAAVRRPWLDQNPFEPGPRYWLPEFNPDRTVFSELLAYAPGMNTTSADVRAVLEAEAEPPEGPFSPGHVDPKARRLIETARNAPWQTATVRDAKKKTLLAIDFDGTGCYRYQRATRHGLREEVLCDGRQLWHLYPELGVGARRDASRFHRAELSRLVPWSLPPAADLAWGADVVLVDDHTVAIVPQAKQGRSPLPQAGEGQGVRAAPAAAKPQPGGEKQNEKTDQRQTALTPNPSPASGRGEPMRSPSPASGRGELFRLLLVFAAEGRLAERRLVRMPSGKTLARECYAADGEVELLDAKDKVLAQRKLDLAPCKLPDLRPEVREMVVLPMPLRTRNHLQTTRGLDPAGKCEAWSEEDALAVIAADIALRGAETQRVVGRRFFNKGDRRPGFYTLLLDAMGGWEMDKDLDLGDGVRVRFDPLADHPDRPLARYVAAWAKPRRVMKHNPAGSIGGPEDGFLQQLTRLEKLREEFSGLPEKPAEANPFDRPPAGKPQPVPPDRDGLYVRGLEFVRGCRSPEMAWAIVTAMRDHADNEARRRNAAEAAACLENGPPLQFAARYQQGAMLHVAFSNKGREVLDELLADTAAEGLRPPLDGTVRQAFLSGPGGEARWDNAVRAASARLVENRARPAAIAMAYDLHRVGDPGLADEVIARATANVPDEEKVLVTLVAVRYFWQTGQQPRADETLQTLLDDAKAGQQPALWLLAATVADQRKAPARALRARERAVALQYDDPPPTVSLDAIRNDHREILAEYQRLAKAISIVGAQPPQDFLRRIVEVADRWRRLDPEPTDACQTAGVILGDLGAADLAWDYLTTPLAAKPNEAAGWVDLGGMLRQQGLLEMADRAYAAGQEAEPTNAQILWDRAQVLLQAGRTAEGKTLLHTLAEGQWPPQYQALQAQAQRQLEKK